MRKCVLFVHGHVSSRANRQCALAATLVPRVNQANRDNHSLRTFSVAGYRGLASPISAWSVFPLVAGNVEITRTANTRTVVLVNTAIYFVFSFFCAPRRKLHLLFHCEFSYIPYGRESEGSKWRINRGDLR